MVKLVDVFCFFDRGVYLFNQLVQVLHQGFWLGVLSRRDFHRLAERRYTDWENYSDREYNLSGWVEWEQKVWDRHFLGCKTILLGGAGGGREIFPLLDQGAEVVAFECNPHLVQVGKKLLAEEKRPATLHWADPDRVPEGLGRFDGAIIGWGAYTHIRGRAVRIDFLKEVRRHLGTGSPLLISFFHRGGGRSYRWIYGLAKMIQLIQGSRSTVELGDTIYGSFDHYFTEGEIAAELEAAGFALDVYHSSPFGHAVGRVR